MLKTCIRLPALFALAALAAAPAMARETRSAQSLPPQAQGQVHADTKGANARGSVEVMAAAATPAYCSGNKNGIGNGASLEHGQGKALTCAKSPG